MQELLSGEEEKINRSSFDVRLTYKDTDGDSVLITSTPELEDAIEQYKESKTLKILAEVKQRKSIFVKHVSSAASQTREEPSSSTASQTEPPALQTSPGTQTKTHKLRSPQVVVESVVEGAVAVLDAAAAAITLATAEKRKGSGQIPSCASTASSSEDKPSHSMAKSSVKNPNLFIHARHTCDGCFTTPIVGNRYHAIDKNNFDLCELCHGNYNGPEKFTVVELDCDRKVQGYFRRQFLSPREDEEPRVVEGSPAEPKEENRPFIHGRHTCDSCLTTPIIGARYHAKNRSDFDLCETCFLSYRGPEEFEPAELDRDRPMQDRWHVSHTRFLRRQNRMRNHPRRHGGRHGWHRRHPCYPQRPPPFCPSDPHGPLPHEPCPPAPCPPPQEEYPRPHCAPSHSGQDQSRELPTPVSSDSDRESLFDDLALKEAIRRSLEEPENDAKKFPKSESFAQDACGNGEVADFIGQTLDRIAHAIEDVNDELKRESVCSSAASPPETDVVVPGEAIQEDGWSIVQEEDTSLGPSFAQATKAIGSALYESELSRGTGPDMMFDSKTSSDAPSSHGSRSSVSGSESSSSISTASSVPTTVRTLTEETPVPEVLLQRWADQIFQLHELGFHNEALNVDIMERFAAANIGSDEDEEVSVTRVVNELVSKNGSQ